ncbi:hypothetical protein BY996DRAFT_8457820, partial [Phakopsora pachyrhizi]
TKTTTASSTTKQSVSSLSTHYYSIVPLHLIFTTYVIHFLPIIQSLKLSKPTGTSAKSKMNILVDSLVEDPYQTLLIINSDLFLVQFWFSSSLRKLREDQINNISDSNLVDRDDTIKQTNVLGGMKHVLRNVFLSEFDHVIVPGMAECKFVMLVQESVTITILGTFMIHMVMVLLGYNLIKNSFKTILISDMVSIVCVLPTSFVIGWNRGRKKQWLISIFSSFQ